MIQWMLIAFICFVFWCFAVEPNWHRLRKVKVPGQRKLKRSFTVLHLSDIHFVGKIGRKKKFFQKLSMLNPDLIVVTGDVIDTDAGIQTAATQLSGLRARYGTYLTLGNHDYYDYQATDNVRYYSGLGRRAMKRNNVDQFLEAMKNIGVKVLVNESARIDIHGNPVVICGTDDPVTQKVDFNLALKGTSPETFNVLLTHQLDSVLKLSHHGVDLSFSGHTHGGQIRVPFIGPFYCDTKLPRRYVEGLHEYKDTTVFISRGMGSGRYLPPRFACRPEAILLEVTP